MFSMHRKILLLYCTAHKQSNGYKCVFQTLSEFYTTFEHLTSAIYMYYT